MLDNYKILTITHRNAPLETIGKFIVPISVPHNDLEARLHEIKSNFAWDELLYMATCNRVVYFISSKQKIDDDFVHQFFTTLNPSLTTDEIKLVTLYSGIKAINHINEVAASIDSLVVGEREILRQLREAYAECNEFGLTGDDIRLAMRFVVETAKKVYSDTKIGEKAVSVVSLAIHKLMKQKPTKDARILLIGAGQTNTLVSKFLVKYEFSNITVFNRNIANSKQLAERCNGVYHSLDALKTYSNGFDIIIVCTGATSAIIDETIYTQLLQAETDKKIVLDLAIPNNVDKNIIDKFNIKYIEIEGLRLLAQENRAFREQEVIVAKDLIEIQVKEFISLYQQRQIERAMQSLPAEVRAMKEKAINEVFCKELATLDPHSRAIMEKMMDYMEKKCIGIPMKVAKMIATN